MYVSNRLILSLLAFIMLAFTTSAFSRKPNIIVILVDDLGYGDLSSYGAPDLQTPNIDALITGGMRFDQFYANCNVCTPTRAALLTGRYPDLVGAGGVIRQTGANNDHGFFNTGAITLPDVLKQAGYHTSIIGKWHLGLVSPNTPNERGFDHFHGFLADMMNDYWTHERFGANYMRLNDQEINPTGHATDLFSEWAVDYIHSRVDQPEPFFMYLAYNAPHFPVQPPVEYITAVEQREPQLSNPRKNLVAFIEHLDDGIGLVMEALSNSGMEENTLVIYSSDNGGHEGSGARNDPYRGWKQDNWEGGIRVGTGFKWPGVIQAGTTSNRVGLTMDIFPTLCEITHAPCGHEMEGRSVWPTLLGLDQPEDDRYLFWMRDGDRPADQGVTAYYAARKGDFKIVENRPSDPFWLYNLADDPGEINDLGQGNPNYNDLVNALNAHIALADTVDPNPGADPVVPVTLTLNEAPGVLLVDFLHTIEWSSNFALNTVNIDYATGDYLWQPIAADVAFTGNGSFEWQVPESLANDSVIIRISGLDGNVSDISNNFHPVQISGLSVLPGSHNTIYHFTFAGSPHVYEVRGDFKNIIVWNSRGEVLDKIAIQGPHITWAPSVSMRNKLNHNLVLVQFKSKNSSKTVKAIF